MFDKNKNAMHYVGPSRCWRVMKNSIDVIYYYIYPRKPDASD